MKSFLIVTLSFITISAQAQEDAASKAREHMFKVLTAADGVFIEDVVENMERAPWEALAYMEEDKMLSAEDLQEAVPDYYRFKNNLLQLKLVDPKNLGSFGTQVTIPYKVDNDETILLLNPRNDEVKDSWDVLYLDKNYLALDMGDVRLFFIHTTIKE